jgi:hypothetical protein
MAMVNGLMRLMNKTSVNMAAKAELVVEIMARVDGSQRGRTVGNGVGRRSRSRPDGLQ